MDSNQGHHVIHVRPGAEQALGFAYARQVGDDLFVAGITSLGEGLDVIHTGNMTAQVAEVYGALAGLLEREGFALSDLVEERVFVTDMAAFVAANEARKTILAGALPAMTAVEVSALVLPGLMIEVAGLARRATAAAAGS